MSNVDYVVDISTTGCILKLSQGIIHYYDKVSEYLLLLLVSMRSRSFVRFYFNKK